MFRNNVGKVDKFSIFAKVIKLISMKIWFDIVRFNNSLRIFKIQYVFLVLVLGGCSTTKSITPNEYSLECINNLKNDGTLIVFIPSHQKKISELEKIVKSKESKSSKATTWLNKAKTERDLGREIIINTVNKVYNFSKVTYAYDFAIKDLIEDKSQIETVDIAGNTSIIKLDGFHLMATYLWKKELEEPAVRKYFIKDLENKLIPAPFPNSFKLKAFRKLFRDLFQSDEVSMQLNIEDIFKSMNLKFHQFLN